LISKYNIFANYISHAYVTLVGILMVPVHVRYLGAEAYGLVGFFSLLQVLFQVLDMGLTPALTRETARFRGGACDAVALRRMLRSLEGVFVGVALLGAGTLAAGSGFIAHEWLNVQQLSLTEVRNAIILMALIVALRWTCGLYRGAINGFDRQLWLSGYNIAVASARFVLVIPFFILVGTSIIEFFLYQLAVTALELLVLVAQTYRLLPTVAAERPIPWQWAPLRGVLKFSLSMALSSVIMVAITQVDKLALSKLMSLSEYAYFTLVVLLANGVGFVSLPIATSLLPQLNKLASQDNDEEFYRLYRWGTQMAATITIPAATVLALFAHEVLWIWTGSRTIANSTASVLSLYAIGNALMALSMYPSHLQVAKGDLRLQVKGYLLCLAGMIPVMIWAIRQYGMLGAGYSWCLMNLIYFALWVLRIHFHFNRSLHFQWLRIDIGEVLLPCVTGALAVRYLFNWSDDRTSAGAELCIVSLLIVLFAAAGSRIVRQAIRNGLKSRKSTHAARHT
jgi:O-antigen/teichoic acid export membrane protein